MVVKLPGLLEYTGGGGGRGGWRWRRKGRTDQASITQVEEEEEEEGGGGGREPRQTGPGTHRWRRRKRAQTDRAWNTGEVGGGGGRTDQAWNTQAQVEEREHEGGGEEEESLEERRVFPTQIKPLLDHVTTTDICFMSVFCSLVSTPLPLPSISPSCDLLRIL